MWSLPGSWCRDSRAILMARGVLFPMVITPMGAGRGDENLHRPNISPVSREGFDAVCGLSSHPISCHSDYSSSHCLHRVVEFCWLRRCADASFFPFSFS